MNPAGSELPVVSFLGAAGWTTDELLFGGIVILIAAMLLAAIALAAVLLRTSRIERTLSAEVRRSEDLREMVAVHGQTLIAMRSSLVLAEEKINEFTGRSLEIQSQFSNSRSFEEASRVIREGGSAHTLMADCGLSGAEAELMVRLHQNNEPPRRKHLKQAPLLEVTPESERGASAHEAETHSAGENRLREALNAAGAG